ncbi:MAG: alpha/beta hydrolase-fold protein [Bacteroidales bacterium]|nr:alpha/beta hydrolase-fold protein [Bacteroidales bacterium]
MNSLRTLIIVLSLGLGIQVTGQNFKQFISRLNSLPEAQRQAVADSLMKAAQTIPLIENDTTVHFLYNGDGKSVELAGDFTGWKSGIRMNHISGCNFRYYTATYEADARLEYQFVINSTDWILDPSNPNKFKGGLGQNSEFRMPGYRVPPEISFYPVIPHGMIRDTTIYSTVLNNDREILIYLPPGYPAEGTSYPVILFHDGIEYIRLFNAGNVLDYLIAKQMMSPVIAVFVPPVDREAEFSGNKIDSYTQFITGEMMPLIDSLYPTSRDPSDRAMAGISNGGNISLYIGMKHPEVFGKISAQSSNIQTVISRTFSTGKMLDLELYLDIGAYDLDPLMPMVRNFRDILAARGYEYQFNEWHEGHSWGNWQCHLRMPLIQFFPYR